MERHLDKELQELKTDILRMGGLVEYAIGASVEALKQLDRLAAEQVICSDKAIDELELGIDEKSLDLLALYQPMAVDLRFITMAMKISTDLERMADLAVDIAQRVLELSGKPLLKPLVDIPRLAAVAQDMTKGGDRFLCRGGCVFGKNVILRDTEADSLRNKSAG